MAGTLMDMGYSVLMVELSVGVLIDCSETKTKGNSDSW